MCHLSPGKRDSWGHSGRMEKKKTDVLTCLTHGGGIGSNQRGKQVGKVAKEYFAKWKKFEPGRGVIQRKASRKR